MLYEVKTDSLRLRGVSLGGVYTSIHVPELDALFDIGIPMRSAAGADHIYLSHGHADHIGALASHLGLRALVGKHRPPKLYLPEEIVDDVLLCLKAMSRMQRYELEVEAIAMKPGDTAALGGNLQVRAFRTHHVVPSLGYSLVRKIPKLKPEYLKLPGPEIARLKKEGEDLFDIRERIELSYATDTLIQVLDNNPELYQSRCLILECTFLDGRKSRAASRAGCHIHLDEILERSEKFENLDLVLMHFSQLYKPREVPEILEARCPEALWKRIRPFLPTKNRWPG